MDSAIMAASGQQDFVMQDEEARRVYWSRRKAELDLISGLNGARREGRREGRKEGREERALEIVHKMKEAGISLEQIHAVTGLSSETIEQM